MFLTLSTFLFFSVFYALIHNHHRPFIKIVIRFTFGRERENETRQIGLYLFKILRFYFSKFINCSLLFELSSDQEVFSSAAKKERKRN